MDRTQTNDRLVFWCAVGLAVLVGLALAQTRVGLGLLRASGVVTTPASYTELFFDPASPLPATLPAGVPTPVPVAFVVGNGREARATIPWLVTQSPPPPGAPVVSGMSPEVGVGDQLPQRAVLLVTCTGPSTEITAGVADAPVRITRAVRCVR